MRDYGKISPQFWIGKTGKQLRGNPEAQIVALYLMTSPHAEMTGVFHCPVLYIAHETGLSIEGATKGLQRLYEAGFCTFEAETDTVFIHEMAKYQIGADLKREDNRVKGVQKIYQNMPEGLIRRAFCDKYKDAFFLEDDGKKTSPLQGPSKPRARAGAGARTEVKPLSGKPDVVEVLTYLNQKAKREYRAVDSNLKLIAARLGEGASVADCKAVIDAKVKDWIGDPKMVDYLRPETLFNATKFAGYVGSIGIAKAAGGDPRFAGAK